MKKVNTQKLWSFELGTQDGINVPIWFIVGFQQKVSQNSYNLNIDTFCRRSVTSVHCMIGTEKNPDAAILLNYDDDDYSQRYGQIKEIFRARTKVDILKPYMRDHDFRSFNDVKNIGYLL